ncbi:methyltransferase [Marmoricola endophyticus]|uniref:Methyltransferase n=1 Tax=Marmoricola endophyticus TaxID=2040280 RepID=A0A917BEJ4_9ACTN|nr:16S rRNA (guanine(966)-N(2))-methyltransferase RsmD [Marmoricola endophyticus]GGF39160.1 methyltransferase [Marmoricola endophyticus]
MTRLIGGTHGGRRLRTPPGDRTRPTSDRVREALFSALESRLGGLAGLRVLDLYAGSGALGLEAASRGAADVVLVESDRRTAGIARRNAADVGLSASVQSRPVERYLADADPVPVHLVLADPPYPLGNDDVVAVLGLLLERGWLAPDAVVVLERSARDREPDWPEGLQRERAKEYGETVLWWLAPDPAR